LILIKYTYSQTILHLIFAANKQGSLPKRTNEQQQRKSKSPKQHSSATAHAHSTALHCCTCTHKKVSSDLLPSPTPSKKKSPLRSSRRGRKRDEKAKGGTVVPVKRLSALPSLAHHRNSGIGGKKPKRSRSISLKNKSPTFFPSPSVCFRRATDVFSWGWGGRPATTELRGGSWE